MWRECYKKSMGYFVYFLLSEKNNDLYVGSSGDLESRVKAHNAGKSKSTKAYRPWKLLGYERYVTRSEAMQREKFLKSHQQKDLLRKKYNI